ncbi:MAG: hypothetical protein ACP5RP_01385 [Candidatus Micrarchaeia archaeon]
MDEIKREILPSNLASLLRHNLPIHYDDEQSLISILRRVPSSISTVYAESNGEKRKFERHTTGKNPGGFVESTSNVDSSSFVSEHALVMKNSTVINSKILNLAVVTGNSFVKNSTIEEFALVAGDSKIQNSIISGNAVIKGKATVISKKEGGWEVISY